MVDTYGHHLRVRVCGVLTELDKILLVKHKGIGDSELWWAPPGGGVEYGESLTEALTREFEEEVGLKVEVYRLLWFEEFIRKPFHAIEFFFEVKRLEEIDTNRLAIDPELPDERQMIDGVDFLTLAQLKRLPKGSYHRLFNRIEKLEDLMGQVNVLNQQQSAGF